MFHSDRAEWFVRVYTFVCVCVAVWVCVPSMQVQMYSIRYLLSRPSEVSLQMEL